MSESFSLADYRKRPQTRSMNFDGVPVKQLVASIKEWQNETELTLATPEDQAIQFYLTNAVFSALAQKVENHQPLNATQQWAMDHYYAGLHDMGLRAFFYTFLICTREARHGDYSGAKPSIKDLYGDIKFFKNIPDDANQIMNHLTNNPPDYDLKTFTNLLVHAFEPGALAKYGGSYGGAKWANVAKPLRDFVHGTITMELFLDTVWTLVHNGGPIFNKGMMYKSYNQEQLWRILDAQRAGMIPNLVWNKESTYVKPHHTKFLTECRKEFPGLGEAQVDWQAVVSLGALGHYPGVKKQASVKIDPVKPQYAPKPINSFQVTPSEHVEKITRAEAHK
jgi:hypothetical protein